MCACFFPVCTRVQRFSPLSEYTTLPTRRCRPAETNSSVQHAVSKKRACYWAIECNHRLSAQKVRACMASTFFNLQGGTYPDANFEMPQMLSGGQSSIGALPPGTALPADVVRDMLCAVQMLADTPSSVSICRAGPLLKPQYLEFSLVSITPFFDTQDIQIFF